MKDKGKKSSVIINIFMVLMIVFGIISLLYFLGMLFYAIAGFFHFASVTDSTKAIFLLLPLALVILSVIVSFIFSFFDERVSNFIGDITSVFSYMFFIDFILVFLASKNDIMLLNVFMIIILIILFIDMVKYIRTLLLNRRK